MKKNYLRITLVTLAILVLSIGIAMLSVTALDGDEIAVTSDEYEEVFTPLSSEGGLIEDEIPSMGEITMGDIIGPFSPVAPDAITTEEIPDGVYALKNVGNTNRWMDMEQNHVEPGKHIQQYAYASSPADTFSRAGLFKISKKPGTTNQYIIRSMLNNRLSFCFKDDGCDEVVTVKIAADDDAVENKYTFTITYSTSGYVIKPYLEDYAISAPNSTASGSSNSYLTGQLISGINDRAKWEMKRYDGENQSGGYITSNKEIAKGLTVGTPYTLTIYGWTTLIGTNKIKLSVPSSYSDIVGGTWNSSTESLPLTVKKAAPFKIDVYMYNTTGSGETLVRSFYGNYMAVPPIEDGMNYFIQNVGTKRYMDVEGPSTAEGAIIQQWSYSTALQKKWIFTRESGGYFTIKSAYSNKYVGVDSTNTSVIRQYGTQSDYTKWYFVGTDSGNYSLHCKAPAVTGVLALPSVSSGDGANLRIYAYTDDTNYCDEWLILSYIVSVINYYDKSFTAFNQDHLNLIPTAIEYLNIVYGRYFGVGFIMDGNAELYTDAIADQCRTGLNSPCSTDLCGGHLNHHKRVGAVLDQLDYELSRENDHLYVLWAHREKGTICVEKGDSCDGYSANGVTHINSEIAFIIRSAESETNYVHNMSNFLAHEVAHCFNQQEVYNNPSHKSFNSACIMGGMAGQTSVNFYNGVVNNTQSPFCESCMQSLKNLVPQKIFEGN